VSWVVWECRLYFRISTDCSVAAQKTREKKRMCTSRVTAPEPWVLGSQASPPGPPHLRCSASQAKVRRFASAVAALRQMSLAVFESTSAASQRSSQRRQARMACPSWSLFSSWGSLPWAMAVFICFILALSDWKQQTRNGRVIMQKTRAWIT
jgi:hypothetical protein